MKQRCLTAVLAVVCMVPAVPGAAIEATQEPISRANAVGTSPLGPLQFLVGSCWSARFPNGAEDTHCFSGVYDGHFIRDVHVVTGDKRPYGGETLYHWDAKAKVVRYTYWTSLGGVSIGTMTVEGNRLMFPETHESASGERVEYRNAWSWDGADKYVANTEKHTAAGWVPEFKLVYERRAKR
jgi:hypothetical protein